MRKAELKKRLEKEAKELGVTPLEAARKHDAEFGSHIAERLEPAIKVGKEKPVKKAASTKKKTSTAKQSVSQQKDTTPQFGISAEETKVAQELSNILSKSGRSQKRNDMGLLDTDHRVDGTDFKHLGAGSFRDVYLHAPTGKIYKIDHTLPVQDAQRIMDAEREAYSKIDTDELAKHKVRYASTSFGNLPDGRPVVVQEAVNDLKDYGYDTTQSEWQLAGEVEQRTDERMAELEDTMNSVGYLSDFQTGNGLYNKKTDELVLFDCLKLPDDLYDLRYQEV